MNNPVDIHSINLVLRYCLLIAGLAGTAWWGYRLDSGSAGYFFLAGIPLFFLTLWRSFNVKKDPYRSGEAPVKIRGGLRLALEAMILLFAALAIYQSVSHFLGYLYLASFIFHCILSRDRILWMLKK